MATVSRFGYVLPLAPRIQSSQRRCWLLRPRVTSCLAKPVVDCIYAKKKFSQCCGFNSYVHTTTPVLSIEYKISLVVCASLSVLNSEIGKTPLATAQLEPTTSRTSQKSSDPKGETRNMRFQEISTDQPHWKVYNKQIFHVHLHLEVTTMLFRNPSPTWTEQPQVSHIRGKQNLKTCRSYHANAQEFLSGTRSGHDLWHQLTYTSKHHRRSRKTRGLRVATSPGHRRRSRMVISRASWPRHLPSTLHLRGRKRKHYVKANKANQNEPLTSYV